MLLFFLHLSFAGEPREPEWFRGFSAEKSAAMR
jgi:hypothetical protein